MHFFLGTLSDQTASVSQKDGITVTSSEYSRGNVFLCFFVAEH